MSKGTVLAIAVACAAASGAIGAVVATIVAAPPPPVAAAVEQRVQPNAALEREIAALRESNKDLARRIEMLEDHAAEPRDETREVVVPPPSPAEEKADQELKGLAAALNNPGAPVPPQFRATVGEALKSIREDEDRERRDRAAQIAATRIEDRLNDLTQKLGLAPSQTKELRDLFTTQTAKREEIWRSVQQSGDFSNARDVAREMRESMDQGLAQILTPAQLEEYKKLDERDARFDGGFGFPRRGPRNPDGGGN